MASYLDMVNRIADESLRADMVNQIKLCIQEAIAHHEVERFWFNQFRDRTFDTVAGREFYDGTDLDEIPDVLELDTVTIAIGGARRLLSRAAYAEIEAANADMNARGQPTSYAYWGRMLRLYPVPDAVYTLRLSGLFKLPALSADDDQNAWTNDAEDLIRYRAKSIFYSQYLRDDANAARAAALEGSARERLAASTARRLAGGEIRPAL
ncbi:MAG: hypothetical protein JNN33_07750 [Rhodospirillaceae bacterium]|nr:hypothetical protein [Rhodospirillaceae bacterium]